MNSIPYSQLARIYDRVMAHVNYKMWAVYINNLFQFADFPVKNLIDLACGTGKHISFFLKNNISVMGADKSLDMLKTAKRKTSLKNVHLIAADASQSALKSELFDAVLMLYDSVNYIKQDKHLADLFCEVERILKPGGLFIFDIVTHEGLKESLDDYYESNSWNGLAYQRHSWFNIETKMQHNEFSFIFNGKSYKEAHTQSIRERHEWINFIEKSRMKLMHEFSNFTFLPADSKSGRIHYICKK